MSKTFSCTFLTDAHHDETLEYAREYKHMTISEFARFAMNEYRKKYPYKGASKKIDGESREGAKAVQPEGNGGK